MAQEIMQSVLYPKLFEFIYGEKEDLEDEQCTFSADYYAALMDRGVLRKETQKFEKETKVWREALETLGNQQITRRMSRSHFVAVVRDHLEQFVEGGVVCEWLCKETGHEDVVAT
jgi:hypothetical protein